jgi:FdrA protein
LPSVVLNRVERGRYLDSVALMRLSRRVAALPGIEGAAMMIGTPSNKELLRDAGLLEPPGEQA